MGEGGAKGKIHSNSLFARFSLSVMLFGISFYLSYSGSPNRCCLEHGPPKPCADLVRGFGGDLVRGTLSEIAVGASVSLGVPVQKALEEHIVHYFCQCH